MPRAEAALRSDVVTANDGAHLAHECATWRYELARIEDYYEQLAADLNRRRGRAARRRRAHQKPGR